MNAIVTNIAPLTIAAEGIDGGAARFVEAWDAINGAWDNRSVAGQRDYCGTAHVRDTDGTVITVSFYDGVAYIELAGVQVQLTGDTATQVALINRMLG